jgi:hypothetical protein
VLGTGPSDEQHSWPLEQQSLPQQSVPLGQLPPSRVQGGARQKPLSHRGDDPVHPEPHAPQFIGSLLRLTQLEPQQARPCPHCGTHNPALPPLEHPSSGISSQSLFMGRIPRV